MTYSPSYWKHLTNFYQANESPNRLADLQIRWKYEDVAHRQRQVWISPVQYPTAFFFPRTIVEFSSHFIIRFPKW
jgi:hypothetical protein